MSNQIAVSTLYGNEDNPPGWNNALPYVNPNYSYPDQNKNSGPPTYPNSYKGPNKWGWSRDTKFNAQVFYNYGQIVMTGDLAGDSPTGKEVKSILNNLADGIVNNGIGYPLGYPYPYENDGIFYHLELGVINNLGIINNTEVIEIQNDSIINNSAGDADDLANIIVTDPNTGLPIDIYGPDGTLWQNIAKGFFNNGKLNIGRSGSKQGASMINTGFLFNGKIDKVIEYPRTQDSQINISGEAKLDNKNIFWNQGTINLETPLAQLNNYANLTLEGGTINNVKGGTIYNKKGATLTLRSVRGTGIPANIYTSADGTHFVNDGIVNIQDGPGGTTGGYITGGYSGTGTLSGQHEQTGVLAPGNSAGGMLFRGNLTLAETSTKEIELGGTDHFDFHRTDAEHDFVEITGDLIINGGELNVSLIDGFKLDLNQEFDIVKVDGELTGTYEGLEEGAIVGSFDSVYGQIGMNLFITYEGGDGNDIALYTADNLFGISNI